MLIYVAGPLSAETDDGRAANVHQALLAGKAVMERGHWPVIPHLNLMYGMWHQDRFGAEPDYETYLAWDAEILRRCDALLYLGPSPGADREREWAERVGMPVYRSLDELPATPMDNQHPHAR